MSIPQKIQLAMKHHQEGRLQQAKDIYLEVLKSEPDNAEANHRLGLIAQQLKKYDDAVQLISRAIDKDSTKALYFNNLGAAQRGQGKTDEAIASFNKALSLKPDSVPTLINLAFAYGQQKDILNEAKCYKKILKLDPENHVANVKLEKMYIGNVKKWHYRMLNDLSRNNAYEKAIKKAVKSNYKILDIGTGSGLLSMMAARSGADFVYTCETNAIIADKACEIIKKNGYENQIKVINKYSTDLQAGKDVPEDFDLIICEIFDAGLFGEGAYIALQHAREKLLAPGGKFLPLKAKIYAVLVDSEDIWKENHVETVNGFDLNQFNELSTWSYFVSNLNSFQHKIVSEITEVFDFDFLAPIPETEYKEVKCVINKDGKCHAICFWFRLYLDDEIYIENVPEKISHWDQAIQYLSIPLDLRAGQEVTIRVKHRRGFLTFLDPEPDTMLLSAQD